MGFEQAHNELKVNIAVCGLFQYQYIVPRLSELGVLGKFYYSHALRTNAGAIGIKAQEAENIFLKEYLVHAHLRTLGNLGRNNAFLMYSKLWEKLVLRRWIRADVFHLMMHGDGVRLLERARKESTVTYGNPVNSHPDLVYRLLTEEKDRLGIKSEPERSGYQQNQLRELELCDHLYVRSQIIKSSYVAYGYPEERISVIHPSVDLSRFRGDTRRTTSGIFRVLSVGQLSLRKGHIDLLEAWTQFGKNRAELTIVGALRHPMRRVLIPYRDHFRHVRQVPNSRLKYYYNAADVFVLPSIEDGFGFVVLEAMACGTPVIVSENTGAADFVRDGENGFVVPIRDPQTITERLQRLYKDRELLRTMGQAALETAQTIPSWRDVAGCLYDDYVRLTSQVR